MTSSTGPNRLVVDDVSVDMVGDSLEISAALHWDHFPAGVPSGTDRPRLVQRIHDLTTLGPAGNLLPGHARADGATSLLPLVVLLAATTGADLRVTTPVCPVALSGARQAVSLCNRWFGWRAPHIAAPTGPDPSATMTGYRLQHPEGRGLFFSRGLDSMAVLTAMTEANRAPTHLVGMDWVDPPYAGTGQREIWLNTAAAAADGGHTLVRVSTNARLYTDPVVHWSRSHAVVLSASALTLGPLVVSVGIASTHTADHNQPYGSHLELDPLWSSSSVSVQHRTDVAGDRLAKAAAVANDEWVCRWLKVCWERPGDGNCGRCRKCLMTMGYLWLVGRGDVVGERFDGPLVPEAILAIATDQPMGSPVNFVNIAGALHDVANGVRARHVRVGDNPGERHLAAVLAEAWDVALAAAGVDHAPTRNP